jgi:hypothetical protein
MARIYKYAILVAIPNERRGERVNIGVAVFRDRTVDVRLMHASQKLNLLTRENWDARLEAAKDRLCKLQSEGGSPAETLERFGMFEPLVSTSGLGSMSVDGADDYERQVEQILGALVSLPPRAAKTDRSTRINTEIARDLKAVIAPKGAGVEQNKVVRDYEIDAKQGLRADFALKNGVMHVIATLDLRRQDVDLGPPAVKSLMLDESLKKFGLGKVKRFGAYAVDPGKEGQFSQHLAMLGNHAVDGFWDWNSGEDRNKLRKSIFDALEHDSPLV